MRAVEGMDKIRIRYSREHEWSVFYIFHFIRNKLFFFFCFFVLIISLYVIIIEDYKMSSLKQIDGYKIFMNKLIGKGSFGSVYEGVSDTTG